MDPILDLNNAFVYYVARINPGKPFADTISVLAADQVNLVFAGDVTYDPPIDVTRLRGTPELLDSSSFENDTSVQDSQVVRLSGTNTASFSTSFTEGIKIGAETKVTSKIPFLAEGQVTLSAEGSFSSTQNDSSTQSQTFEVVNTINIAPHTRVEASLLISSLQYKGKLSAKVQVAGQLRIAFGDTHFAVDIADVFKAIKSRPPGSFILKDDRTTYTFTDGELALFEVTETNEVLYRVTAAIDAKFGASQIVKVKEFDITSGRMVKELTL
jgi:hypothetical protein